LPDIFAINDKINIRAPIGRCFLLATNIEIVGTVLGMKPVQGRTSGIVGLGDTIRWQGWKFGLPAFHESLIDVFDPPHFFRDRMIAGRFATFSHDHNFRDCGDGTTLMSDELRFTMPFGAFGELAGQRILVPHIRELVQERFAMLKQIAESEEWREYLAPASKLE
jgi:ligand-binding SRPBCC domain-containing protein